MHRMHEVLREEQGVNVGYSTLTRAMRRLGLCDGAKPVRAVHVPDVPGQEMQHDTSTYPIALGDHAPVKLVCSVVYLRYCKMRYVKFYRTFNRFHMKCFMDEALGFFGYCARDCIIDNTSLAVVSGCGADALFAPEMVAFANNYGFHWVAHALGHANRKAGNERSFWTVETSFLPGRRFASLEDLNAQALSWATQSYARRPQSHTGLIPVMLFDHEKQFLHCLAEHISPPTLPHRRTVDSYGYIRFDRNFYWVPQGVKEVGIVQYSGHIVIYAGADRELIRYPLPPDGTEKQVFAPKQAPRAGHQPRNLKPGCDQQERLLRDKDPEVAGYIDFIRSADCPVRYKPRFIRQLYELSRSCDETVFLALLRRALEFRVSSMEALLRIAVQISSAHQSPHSTDAPPTLPAPQDYQDRPQFRHGEFSCEHPTDPTLLDTPKPSQENADGSTTP
jgi:hypothetical protein